MGKTTKKDLLMITLDKAIVTAQAADAAEAERQGG